jgi:hypothetical protein
VFERFTERARQVVVLAQDEARALKHNYIGTEHILLGLLRGDGLPARVLRSLDVTADEVRAQVVLLVGQGDEESIGQLPMTPRAKRSMELALREALSLKHNYIGAEHLLLGLVALDDSVGARILFSFDVTAEKIRNETIRMLSLPRTRQGQLDPLSPAESDELERVAREKQEALEDQQFERAAKLRDRERELRQRVSGSRVRANPGQLDLARPGTLLAASGCGFAVCVALSAIVDRQRADAYLLGLAAVLLSFFVGSLSIRLQGRGDVYAAVAAVAGAAAIALYAVLALQHLRVPSGERDTEGWVFALSFPQAALLAAAAFATGRMAGLVSAALAVVQLGAGMLLMFERTGDAGVALSPGTFALWAAVFGLLALRTRGRVSLRLG